MDYSKELLLFVATTLVSVGATQIASDIVLGVILLLLGALVFVGRGFYKKYLEKKDDEKTDKNNN
jgi:hypothetical protein